ncbi:MAG: phospholipase D family protein [Thermoproteota archaeon]
MQTVTYTTVIPGPGVVEVLAVRFSPNGGCKSELLHWINRANHSIYVLIYSFTLDEVGDALISAKSRGVDVKVVFDSLEANATESEYQKLRDAGVDARADTRSAVMNNKVAVIDGEIVITGSFNWSDSAEEENNENLIVLKSQSLAETYTNEFWRIWNTWT